MANTKKLATEYQMGQWAEIMRRRTESGTSIRAFCREEGIHPNRYHYWQRRLREAALGQLPPAGWAQIDSAQAIETIEKGEVRIEIGKCRITANEGTNADILTKVCKVLVELC